LSGPHRGHPKSPHSGSDATPPTGGQKPSKTVVNTLPCRNNRCIIPRFSIWQEYQNEREKDREQEAKNDPCHQEEGGAGQVCQTKKTSRKETKSEQEKVVGEEIAEEESGSQKEILQESRKPEEGLAEESGGEEKESQQEEKGNQEEGC
jgi:hypothetical protein